MIRWESLDAEITYILTFVARDEFANQSVANMRKEVRDYLLTRHYSPATHQSQSPKLCATLCVLAHYLLIPPRNLSPRRNDNNPIRSLWDRMWRYCAKDASIDKVRALSEIYGNILIEMGIAEVLDA